MRALFCTDGSEAALYSFKMAQPFLPNDCSYDIAYVIDKSLFSFLRSENKQEASAFSQKSANSVLKNESKKMEAFGVFVENEYCLEGHPATEIIKLAKDKKYDALILGTHGKSGIVGWLGSVSRDVIMNSTCPVFVARPGKTNQKPDKRLLFTVNDTERAVKMVETAINLLDFEGSNVNLATVIDGPECIPSELVMDDTWLADVMAQGRKKATSTLESFSKLLESKGINVNKVMRMEGFVASEILEYVNNNPVDLVVIGSHGRDDLINFLLGSVAKRVLDNSLAPVLVVPNRKTN